MADEADVIEALMRIIQQTPGQSDEPVGFLTTENRDVWGRAYQTLKKGFLAFFNTKFTKAFEVRNICRSC